jgi:hypothetical protein
MAHRIFSTGSAARTPVLVAAILTVFITRVWSDTPSVDHWETVVFPDYTWHYFAGSSEPPSDWYQPGFNPAAWATGPGGIGYGDNDDATVIGPTLSLYMRLSFQIADTSDIARLLLHVDYDDGFIAWINGREVARANMGDPGTHVPYNRPSTGLQEALLYQGQAPDYFLVEKGTLRTFLVEGENVLALQVQNQDIGSSDLSSACWLSVGIRNPGLTYSETPSWFEPPYEFTSSNLPILVINTGGRVIPDDPKLTAEMGLIDNGPGRRNGIGDPWNGYEGRIGIEMKGESSQMFPKKSYFFETRDSLGENRNVSLLGMPAENDWVLYAPYTDKSLLRNSLTFLLAAELGGYVPRARFCELVLNGDYQGIYVLMERIKRDKNRVDISKLDVSDLAGDAITGGYILRVDKHDASDDPGWVSVPAVSLPGERNLFFQYFDPKYGELQEAQRSYIRNFIYDFESVLSGPLFNSRTLGYARYIDVPSFIDHIIMTEISKNIDGYVFSTYMYKDRNSKGGLLHMGPLWDFDLAYGNLNYNDLALKTPGWLYTENYRMYWFRRLMEDPNFRNRLRCRWDELRSTVLSNARVSAKIDSLVAEVSESQERNFKRWKILGQYVWPNSFIGNTFEEEVQYLTNWITDRLDWMTLYIGGNCESLALGLEDDAATVMAFPNPFSTQITFQTGIPRILQIQFQLVDATGRVYHTDEAFSDPGGAVTFQIGPSPALRGLFLARLTADGIPLPAVRVVMER